VFCVCVAQSGDRDEKKAAAEKLELLDDDVFTSHVGCLAAGPDQTQQLVK